MNSQTLFTWFRMNLFTLPRWSVILAYWLVICNLNYLSCQECEYDTCKLRTPWGAPMTLSAPLTAGPNGPIIAQDTMFLDVVSSFAKQQIITRKVHAQGAGVWGYFEATNAEITKYTKAVIFSEVGRQTEFFARASTSGQETGAADVGSNPYGMAIKFQTEDGIYDLITSSIPILLFRNPMVAVHFYNMGQRDISTNLPSVNALWDFNSRLPETVHALLYISTDQGIPDGYLHANFFTINTFVCVNNDGVAVYCKFKLESNQGLAFLSAEEAWTVAGKDPNYAGRKLYNAIKSGEYPTWTLFLQVMTFEQAEQLPFNALDVTKVWSEVDFPLIEAGRIVFNKMANNRFDETESAAFYPGNLIPGIEASADRILQARLVAYKLAQYNRLGRNYQQFPINYPKLVSPDKCGSCGCAFLQDQSYDLQYFSNSVACLAESVEAKKFPFPVSGDTGRYSTYDDDNYSQATALWQSLDDEHKKRVVAGMCATLSMADQDIQDRMVSVFYNVSEELANMVMEKLASG